MLIPGVTDKDAGKHIVYLFFGRILLMLQKPGQQQGCRRDIVRTLHDASIYHSLLDNTQMTTVPETVRSPDNGTLCLARYHEVRIHRHIIEKDGIASGKPFTVIAVTNSKMSGSYQHFSQ